MGELIKWVNGQIQQKGWTMNELARRSGLSSGYTSQVLSGKKDPGPKFYQGIAKAFNVTLESVEQLDQSGGQPITPDEAALAELSQIAQKLPPADLREILEYARYRLDKSHKA